MDDKEKRRALAETVGFIVAAVAALQELGMTKEFFMDAVDHTWELMAGNKTKEQLVKKMAEKHPEIMKDDTPPGRPLNHVDNQLPA